jgi:phosphoinositide-3-kinase regulatory subunit 4
MLEFGTYVDDEIRLGRLIPYTVMMLSDTSSIVRATAVAVLSRLLARIQTLTQADIDLFPEYILPALSRFQTDPEELVRLAYAQNVAQLAETSRKFLDIAHLLKQTTDSKIAAATAAQNALDGGSSSPVPPVTPGGRPASMVPFSGTYDSELSSLQTSVLKVVLAMLAEGSSRVKRALLTDIARLCVFLGREHVNSELLPHLMTLLNLRDWQLRAGKSFSCISLDLYSDLMLVYVLQ